MNLSFFGKRADYIGITGSLLCIIHCLITPALVMTSTLLQHDSLRVGFLSLDYLFIGVNLIAVWSASRRTSPVIRGFLWLFLSLFALGLCLEEVHENFEMLAYVASVGLVVSHMANIWYCRTHHH